ncbi:MAG: potassium transporter TrkA [Candidatus Dactylopiibacterium carminicum]|nr:MAG: potassium transporter TrkA [Candidatus Dactylopiibacterium carminicum]
MGDVLMLALRRLRAPLIALILAYAVSVFGLAVIPGVDPEGRVDSLGFFHAFYIISYTATTIGFGELPHAFTGAQRAWVMFSIYLSVICWAYTFGSVLALVQDATFRGALARSRFVARVCRLEEPFYIIAGYGQSGTALAHALDETGVRTVIVELRPERASHVDVEVFHQPVPALAADARWPDVLCDAGAKQPNCKALIVLVGDDEMAQTIAVGASTLNPDLEVVARVHSPFARANLDAFPMIKVIDPFETFATNLGLAISAPAVLWVEEWLSSVPGSHCPKPFMMPKGHWLLFGFGRFGQAVAHELERVGCTWTAVDPNESLKEEEHLVRLDYSTQSLRNAGLENAVGVVVCTDRDVVNLSLVSRARRIKPDLIVVVRQNHVADASLIEAAKADLVFVKGELMTRECLQLLITPTRNRFLMMVREQGSEMAEQIGVRLLTELEERVPYLWVFRCFASYPGLREILTHPGKQPLRLDELLIDPLNPAERLRAVPLLLLRGTQAVTLPSLETELRPGDLLLFAGRRGVEDLQRRFQMEPSPIGYVRTGVEPARGWLFRRIEHWRQHRARRLARRQRRHVQA